MGQRPDRGTLRRDLLAIHVIGRSANALILGLVVSLTVSFFVNRVLQSILIQVSPTDPASLLIASSVLMMTALLGCLLPARRAMRVDPAIALRYE